MSTETAAERSTGAETGIPGWQAGLLGGVIGTLAFGAMLSATNPGVLRMAIPAMYGIEGPAGLIGWAIHVGHGTVLGVAFAALLRWDALAGVADGTGKAAGVGLVYGVAVWLVLAAFVMPIWLGAVGFPNAPGVPNFGVGSLAGHAVYGVVLGAVYGALT